MPETSLNVLHYIVVLCRYDQAFLAARSSQAGPQTRWRSQSRIGRLIFITFKSGLSIFAVMVEDEMNAFIRVYTVGSQVLEAGSLDWTWIAISG